MSWDERPDELLDGVKGDLITWDEIEEEEDLVEELERAAAAAEAPGTPRQKEQFTMASTPLLANRVRSLLSLYSIALAHSLNLAPGSFAPSSYFGTSLPNRRSSPFLTSFRSSSFHAYDDRPLFSCGRVDSREG